MDKQVIERYSDFEEDIELIETRIEGLEKEKELLLKSLKRGPSEINSIEYDGMPKGSPEHKSVLEIVEKVNRINNMIFIETESLKIKKNTFKRINDKISNIQNLDKKIIFMKNVQNKSLKKIAEELGYNYDYIRRVHANANKKVTKLDTDNFVFRI